MRIPQTSTTGPVGTPQGSPGGPTAGGAAIGNAPRKLAAGAYRMAFGDEFYLWVLVLLEVALTAWLRNYFRRYHGG